MPRRNTPVRIITAAANLAAAAGRDALADALIGDLGLLLAGVPPEVVAELGRSKAPPDSD